MSRVTVVREGDVFTVDGRPATPQEGEKLRRHFKALEEWLDATKAIWSESMKPIEPPTPKSPETESK